MHRIWVEISLDRIAANYHAVAAEAGEGVQVAAVVKADAYRHGLLEVAGRLEAEGARWLAVSNAEEGVALRESGIGTRILVMGDFLPYEREALAEYRLTPAVHSLERLWEWDAFAAEQGQHLCYHLKLDTGMGRLGSRAAAGEIVEAVLGAVHVRLEGVMTHLASAADFTTSQTAEQVMAFESALGMLKQAGIVPELVHMASSAPVAYGMRPTFGTMVRPGLALYGYLPRPVGRAPALKLKVEPALEWKSRILEIKELPERAAVGYGALWRAQRPTRLGVVAAGYADGVPHRLCGGHVVAGGALVPIVGAVSMDLITVDLTEVPQVRIGEAVTLLGREGEVRWDADDLARAAGIISYAVLSGIGNRVKRVYRP